MAEAQLAQAPDAPKLDNVTALTTAEHVLQSLSRRRVLHRLMHDWTARIGLVIVVLLVLVALLAPVLTRHDPLSLDGPALEPPSWSHPFGTDRLGRDVFSRIVYGAQLSLGTALLATVLILTLAVLVGSLSGFLGGVVDSVLMRTVDTILAFPNLLLALVVAGLFRPSLLTLMLALASVWWVGYARIVRGLVMVVRERPFIEAARVGGARRSRLLVRHILPNVLPPVIVLVTLEMGTLILAISALNFLGLGAQPPTPEWGAMLNEGRAFFFSSPHLMLFPGLAISLAVLGFNLLGDGLRDVLDPKS
ncbi:MAG: nickel transporter permease [Pseudonocardiaceae bacterium]